MIETETTFQLYPNKADLSVSMPPPAPRQYLLINFIFPKSDIDNKIKVDTEIK